MKWHREHLPDPLPAEPLELAARWLAEAGERRVQPNPNAMALATVDAAGQPSRGGRRCKQIAPLPGWLDLLHQRLTREGRARQHNPRAAALLYWYVLHRQGGVEGRVERLTSATTMLYFATRNWQSRLGAGRAKQSQPIALRRAAAQGRGHGAAGRALLVPADEQQPDPGLRIARPPLGGFRLWAEAVELWVEGQRPYPRPRALAAHAGAAGRAVRSGVVVRQT